MPWLHRFLEGSLIAALWVVSASSRKIKYRKVIQAILLTLLVAMVLLVHMDYGSGSGDLSTVLLLLFLAPLVLMTVIVHEVSHGWVALQLGDPTPKEKGRLTFNPFKHVSFKWTILFPITTFYLFTVALIMPKPVPINPRNFRNPKTDIMWVGLAGPAVNIFFMLFFALILSSGVIPDTGMVWPHIRLFLMVLVIVNMVLAMFNLIPIPPLDGSRVLVGLLPAKHTAFLMKARVQILGLLFIFTVVIGTAMSIGIARVLIPPIEFVWGILGLDRGEFRGMFAD
ncbi:site-2 protease family protein [bacterium]|nr:site-2 protease family protein [bacterium]